MDTMLTPSADPGPAFIACVESSNPGGMCADMAREWPMMRVANLDELEPAQIAVVFYDGLDAESREHVHARIRAHPDSTVCMTTPACHEGTLQALASCGALRHLLTAATPERVGPALGVTLDRLRGLPRALESYLDEPRVWVRELGADEEDEGVAFAESCAEEMGVAGALVTLFATVVGELLANALHHAPGGDASPRPVRLTVAGDGDTLGVSVRDDYGSLPPERLQELAGRLAKRGEHEVDRGSWGAGVGLVMSFHSLNHLVIDLTPGTQTTVIGTIDVRGGYRNFLRAGRSFNIYVSECM